MSDPCRSSTPPGFPLPHLKCVNCNNMKLHNYKSGDACHCACHFAGAVDTSKRKCVKNPDFVHRRAATGISLVEFRRREDERIALGLPPPNTLVHNAGFAPLLVLPPAPPTLDLKISTKHKHHTSEDDEVQLSSPPQQKLRIQSAPASLSPTRVKLNDLKQSICDQLKCYLCLEHCVHPVRLPCNKCYVCFGCLHQQVNNMKDWSPTSNWYRLSITCEVCKWFEGTETDELLSNANEPEFAFKSLVQLVEHSLLPNVNTCPFCKEDDNLEHVRKCGFSHFTCHRNGCDFKFSAIESKLIKAHQKKCVALCCVECGSTGLTLDQIKLHKKEDKRMKSFAKTMKKTCNDIATQFPIQHVTPIYVQVNTLLELIKLQLAKIQKDCVGEDLNGDVLHRESGLDRLNTLRDGINNFKSFFEGGYPFEDDNTLPPIPISEIQELENSLTMDRNELDYDEPQSPPPAVEVLAEQKSP